jgi:hypothetical protein
VLLPVGVLRRRDLADVIGSALLAKAAGSGHRRIAVELEVPATTVRAGCAGSPPGDELIAGHFARLAAWLDPSVVVPEPRGSPLAGCGGGDRGWRRWSPRGGWVRTPDRSSSPREASGGRPLCNTDEPFPMPW